MYRIIIWKINGDVTSIYITEDQVEFECQVLNLDPMCKEYSVERL